MDQRNSQMRIIRIKQVQERVGLSRSTIYDRINERSPRYGPEFPKPAKLGAYAVGWLEESINEWINKRMNRSV